MKKKLLILVALALLVLPFATLAKESKLLEEYDTLNFKETLKQEEIELKYEDYKETDKQVTIYLFRGNGCSYCDAFLKFLNENAKEYGKYFKLVSFEVWSNAKNAELLDEVSTYLDQSAGGVPYIIIGDEVFPGYAPDYDEAIIAKLKKEYKAKEKYDVLEKIAEERKIQERKEKLPMLLSVICILTSVFVPVICMTVILLQIKKTNAMTNTRISQLEMEIKQLSKPVKVEREYSEKKEHKNVKKNSTKKENKNK